MAQQDITFERKEDIVPVSNRTKQVTAADLNELKQKVTANAQDAESRLLNVENNQYSGVVAKRLYSDLPATGTVDVSYKVSNDPDTTLNGYYIWTGTGYLKTAELNNGIIKPGEIEAVTGDKINRAIIKKSIGKNKFNKDSDEIVVGSYINATGNLIANASYNTTGYIPVSSGAQYTKNSVAIAVYTAFYDEDYNYVGSINSATFTIPSTVEYIRTSYLDADELIFQVEEGLVSTDYEPYTEFSNKIGESDLKNEAVSEDKIKDEAVSTSKTTFIYDNPSNLYNPLDPDAVEGFYLNVNGLPIVTNPSYKTTGFIRVEEGDIIVGGNDGAQENMRYLYSYDSDKIKVGGSEDPARESFTVPAGVVYIRVSFTYLIFTQYQIQKDTITDYVPYSENIVINDNYLPEIKRLKDDSVTTEKISDGAVTEAKIADNSVSTNKVLEGAITEGKTIFFDASINLFNPDDPDVAFGYYIGWDSGNELVNANYNASGFIPINPNEYYTMSFKHQIAWYDSSKNYISGSNSTDTNKTQLAPTNAYYLRCSIIVNFYDVFQVNEGQIEAPYVPYGFTLKEKYIEGLDVAKYESILGNEGKLIEQANLTDGSIIEIDDFPYHLKKGLSMSFYTDLLGGLISDVSYGVGYNKYRGTYFFISPTDVTYYNDGVFQNTEAYGLTTVV